MTMDGALPKAAKVVVIGGGIIGCSTAYHLAKMGCSDVLLLERYQLSAGSTWHAAGAVGQLRANANITQLLKESVEVYGRLEAETGLSTGWVQNGSLRLATTKDRVAEFEVAATMARSFGMEFHFLSPREVQEMVPQVRVDDLECAAFLPSDGVANPADITQAMAKAARANGASVIENTPVTGLTLAGPRVVAVETERGSVACEAVVNAAGIWSREIGAMAGITVPIQPSHHQYFVTDVIDGLPRHAPTIRDTDHQLYFKEEVGGLAVGVYEFDPIPFTAEPIPDDHAFKLLPENIEHFSPALPQAYHRFPDLAQVGVKRWFNGIESFTEDGMFILGPAPGLDNLFVATGFNAFGIASGGGAGKAMAHWVLEGEAPFDLWAADIRRFSRFHGARRQVMVRALEGQAQHYAMHWPHHEPSAGRPLRLSPVYGELKASGACFGSKAGWERANWFAPERSEPQDLPSFGRPNWFSHVGQEHRACREAVALFDQSSFAKFLIVGAAAETVLDRICPASMARAVGSVIYTQMLNEQGGIEADVTVTRLAEDRYFLVTGTGSAVRDGDTLRRGMGENGDVHLVDVTSAYGCLSLMGPNAPEVFSQVCEQAIDPTAFPFGTAKEAFVAGAPVIALRLSYVGEQGWELFVPSEYMVQVYRSLKAQGASLGLRDAGYRAIDSLRLEKARRIWGHDIGPDYTPLEAGLAFAVDFDKPRFRGREALLRQREAGAPTRRLVSLSLDDPEVVLYGRESIYRDGELIGWLTSSGHGHSLDRPLGLGYLRHAAGVDRDFVESGSYELEVRTRRFPARVSLSPLYDPKNLRVR